MITLIVARSLLNVAPAPRACDDEALSCLILDKLMPRLEKALVSQPEGFTLQEFDDYLSRVRRLEKWAVTLKDPCVVKAYQGWLTYLDRRMVDGKTELLQGLKERKKSERDKTENEEKMRKEHCEHYKRTHPPIPEPPR